MKCDENKRSLINFLCDMHHTNQLLSLIGEGGLYTHEEADVVIISYLLQLIQQGKTHIQVLADNTDIFLLLLFFCWIKKTSAYLTMRKYNDKVIDIKTTADKLGERC